MFCQYYLNVRKMYACGTLADINRAILQWSSWLLWSFLEAHLPSPAVGNEKLTRLA